MTSASDSLWLKKFLAPDRKYVNIFGDTQSKTADAPRPEAVIARCVGSIAGCLSSDIKKGINH